MRQKGFDATKFLGSGDGLPHCAISMNTPPGGSCYTQMDRRTDGRTDRQAVRQTQRLCHWQLDAGAADRLGAQFIDGIRKEFGIELGVH
jgi:hypothetical protein